MLTRVPSPAADVVTCRASGTVVARDLASFFAGSRDHGVLIEIGTDFDGYLAELVHGAWGLATPGHRRVALVVPAPVRSEAALAGLDGQGEALRVFDADQRGAALHWITGA
jgi:hypothetical protein